MLLNRLEYALMNTPVHAMMHRRYGAGRLLALGGPMNGGAALEIGCGQGVGAELILDDFRADRVDAFDLDPRMVERARVRLRHRADRVRLWIGDATRIPVADTSYDAVFAFGVVHHVPQWRDAVAEVARVLKPGGRFYAMELLRALIAHPVIRRLFAHPQHDRFDHRELVDALAAAGLTARKTIKFGEALTWIVADRSRDT